MKWITATAVLLFLLVPAMGQKISVDTIMQLDTLRISGERYISFSDGQKLIRIDTEVLHENKRNNIANILMDNTSVYIRSYGQNNVASMSFRGTSSSQSGIFWNGINIRMPSLGSTDLSLIPSSFFNNATIVFGGSSVRYGSGTIGGAIFLNNNAYFGNYISAGLDLRMGSFGYRGADITATLSQKKYYLNFTFSGQQARNDFVYTDLRGEDERMDNAAFSGLGFNLHGAALIGKKSQIDLFLWYQEANREIPPSITMDLSKAYQTDRALRSSIQWKTYFRKGMLNIKSAWFTEYENFTDPRISLSSKICTDIYFLESEYRHQLFRDGTLDAGISLTREEADIDAYYGHKNRDWLAAYINYKHYLPLIKWNLLAGARQEISGHTLAPFTPSFGLEGPVLSFLSHKVSLSRNYRLPTMNELYWQPGGNTDINAESSWNAEFSLISNPVPENETAEVNISATAFSSFVNDWILWLPKNNYWFADNIQKVWARGVELEAYMMLKNNYKYAKLRFSYTYSRSSNEGKDVQEGLVGKQLIYTPMHNAALRLDMGLGSWSVALYNNYTGKSYISSDNMEALPGFFISNIALNKEMNIKQVKINISARINNIFDKDYQLVAFRPMPARNFQLSILLTYKKESYD